MAKYTGHAEDMGKIFKEDNKSVIYGNASFNNRKAAEKLAQERHTTGKEAGHELTGYETITLKTAGRGGQFKETQFDMPIYRAAATPAPTPEPTPPPPAPEPVKEEPLGPVEYSPEIQKAKERVNNYESDIKSGATSDKIFDANRSYTKESNFDFSNNLDFSAKTFGGQSSKAAASFLDNKKQNIKNSFSI